MTSCFECDAELRFRDGMESGELMVCPDCGTELEVTSTSPFEVALAPAEQEDWGE